MKSQNKTKKISLALLLFAMLALTPAAMAATISTDQEDYAPWEIVTITGSGFEPYAPIALTIEWPDLFVDEFYGAFDQSGVFTWTSPTCPPDYFLGSANDSGGFTLVFGKELMEGIFTVVATDGATTATTTFTDAPKVGMVTVGSQSPSPVIAGDSATYTITVDRGIGSGSSGAFTADLIITTTLPTGASASFSPNPVSFTPTSDSRTSTLTITTTASTPSDTTDFTVRATKSTGDYAEGSGQLAVASAPTPAPTVTDVSPDSGNQGEALTGVIITGTNLTGATTVSFGSGIAVNSFAVNDATQITADITIDGGAALGFRDVSVTTPGGTGTLTNGFSVTETPVPTYLVHYVATGNAAPVTVPPDEWVASGDPATGVFPSPVTNPAGDTRSVYVSDDRPGAITVPTTITATYRNEYLVHYAATGNAVPVTVPPDEWVASGDPATGVFPLSVTNGAGDTRSVYVSDDRPATITAPTTITATYGNEYLVHYVATGNAVPVTVPPDEWVASGNPATGVFPSPVTDGAGTRSVYVSDNRPGAITAPTIITATYDNEYLVQYAVTGNVVPVTPPADEWVASGDPATGVFPLSVTNGAGDTRSVYVSDDRPATITAPTTITATYQTQYLVTFDQTGLDGSATGLVVTYSINGGDVPISVPPLSNLPTTDVWVDENGVVEYAYEILVASLTPGYQFWLSGVTGPASPITVDGAVTITGNYTELPKSAVTTSSLCPFDVDPAIGGQQFRLIFTQDPTNVSTFKLTASNPGQFYYNVFYVGTPGQTAALTIDVPDPFVTQGAMPVHVYASVSLNGECFIPTDEIAVFSAQPGNNPDYAVEVTVPDTGLVYVAIHLDYDLKKTVGYSKDMGNNAEQPLGTDVIGDLTDYEFSVGGDMTDVQTIQNQNVFKRNPGFGGIVVDGVGDPVQGATVTITGPGVSATVSTDVDGFYYFYYKHKGKAATYTVSLPAYSQSQPVSVKANGFVEVNFVVP